MVDLHEQAITENTSVQKNYWLKLQQFKFDLFYYCEHYRQSVAITRWIKYITVGLTTASTLAWMEWSSMPSIPILCSTIIIVLQVFNAISDFFPFNHRKDELKDLTNDLAPLYIEMESTWRKVAEGKLSISEINKCIDDFANKRLQIEKNYLKDDFLKRKKKIIARAEKQTQEYFDVFK